MKDSKVDIRMLIQFESLLKKFVKTVIAEINVNLVANKRGLNETRWVSAFVDTRWTTDGKTRIEKLRIKLMDGKIFGLNCSDEAGKMLRKVGKIKDNTFPDKWYGLKLTFTPEGKCTSEFDYNSECVTDDQFFLS